MFFLGQLKKNSHLKFQDGCRFSRWLPIMGLNYGVPHKNWQSFNLNNLGVDLYVFIYIQIDLALIKALWYFFYHFWYLGWKRWNSQCIMNLYCHASDWYCGIIVDYDLKLQKKLVSKTSEVKLWFILKALNWNWMFIFTWMFILNICT